MRFDEDREPLYLGWLFFISVVLHVLLSLAVAALKQKGIELPVELLLIISELSLLVPTVIYILAGNLGFERDLGFRKIKPGTVIMSMVLAVIVTPIATFFNVVSQFFVNNRMVELSDTLAGGSGIVVLLLGAVYAPLCEELTFRSVFARRYEKSASPMGAAIISAVLFALVHMNVNQAMYTLVLGWIFAVINKAARSVYPSLIIHISVNFVNLAALLAATKTAEALGGGAGLAASAQNVRNSDIIYITAAFFLIVAAICAAIAIPCVIYIAKHEGGLDGLYDMFTKKHEKKRWLYAPTVLAVLLVVLIMFGFNSFLKLAGG